MMISNSTLRGAEISATYMGMEFTGTIKSIELNQSGWKVDDNRGRAFIELSNDLVKGDWTHTKAGEQIILDLLTKDGESKRDDTRYTNVILKIKKF